MENINIFEHKIRLPSILQDTMSSILTVKIWGTLLAKSPPFQGLASS